MNAGADSESFSGVDLGALEYRGAELLLFYLPHLKNSYQSAEDKALRTYTGCGSLGLFLCSCGLRGL